MASLIANLFSRLKATPASAEGSRGVLVDQGQLDGIRLRACSAQRPCRAECCSQGVRIEAAEAKRIDQFVRRNPAYFSHLVRVKQALVPVDMPKLGRVFFTEVVTPDGPGKNGIRRRSAKAAPEQGANPDSMCVFALADLRCSLQVAAVALGHHKWAFKPTACWLFPLKFSVHEVRDNRKYYRLDWAGAERPEVAGYPCSRRDPGGERAAKVLNQEIAYFKQQFVD